MSWIEKLCEVYDVVSAADIPKSDNRTQLVRVGFTKKKLDYIVKITADGGFSSVSEPDKQECIVPTTPEAEGRTGDSGAPYPLAENLKYFAEENGSHNALLDSYLAQLSNWCAQPEAPECLRTLLAYLEKRTLLADLRGALQSKPKRKKNKGKDDIDGLDAKAMICFEVEDFSCHQMKVWERKDVQDSWIAYCARRTDDREALCYVTGEVLPVLDNHPKVQGNAKLISAKDVGFPFQYKGRFVENRSASTVSAYASDRAHRALQYLLSNQGMVMRRFGLSVVAWDVLSGAMKAPVDDHDDEDEYEDNTDLPDTFEKYSKTLCKAAKGQGRTAKCFEDCIANLVDGERRAESVIIMSMEAATKGRMSIDYYQELPGGLYVNRLLDWYRSCCWTYWHQSSKENIVRTPAPLEIAEAIMGADGVRRAKADPKGDKSDGNQMRAQMRALYKRLLSCIVDGAPLPRNFVQSAVHRAEAPLTFREGDTWTRARWERCMRTACALIRRSRFDDLPQDRRADSDEYLPSDKLDRTNRNRSYLYGRLLALADIAEYETMDGTEQRKLPTNAVRLMQRFAQRPSDTWLHLHAKLIPYMASLGNSGSGTANSLMCMISEAESLFERGDRASSAALDENVLLGYLAQRQHFYTPRKNRVPDDREGDGPVYMFGSNRSELFGMLAAIADCAEGRATLEPRAARATSPSGLDAGTASTNESGHAEAGEGNASVHFVSTHDGNTAALRMMVQLVQQPAATWTAIHSKLLPYLEKLGIRRSAYYIGMLRAVEGRFDREARFSNAQLDSMFLNGFYRMRACILSGGMADFSAQYVPQHAPATREAAYAALLAIENCVERIVLDLEKDEDENRTSNALRFMNNFAASPASTWRYLSERIRPYLKKLRSINMGLAQKYSARIAELEDAIFQNDWGGDESLHPGWLHDYYTTEHN